MRSLSEVVISQSLGVEWRQKWLPLAWLAMWGLAVMSAAVPYWWVIGLLAIAFWELTWQMSGTDKAPILSLERVNSRAIQWAAFAAITLFLLFWVCVKKDNLPVYGKVPAGKVLWSVLISPITEEIFFRGLMYNGFLFVGRKLRPKRAFETFVMLFVASVFAVAHARTGIYLTLTTLAGVVYGLCRMKSGSVIPAIVCHAVFNALVMWMFGR
jgi:membrane protease YdiL (CAAX protease family)